jgi:hypothetical protein
MTTADETERRSADFTAAHLEEIHASHPGPAAMLYAGAMAATVCAWIVRHHGPRAAFDLMQLLADEILEERLKREGE